MPQRMGPLPIVDVARLVADNKRRVDEMAIVDVRREKRNEMAKRKKKREERERRAPFSLCRQDNLSLKLQPQTSTQNTTNQQERKRKRTTMRFQNERQC